MSPRPRWLGVSPVLLDQAAVSGSNFLAAVLLVRELGLPTFGTWSLIGLATLFAQSLQQALLAQPLQTFAPKLDDAARPGYLAAVARLELGFTALVAAVAAAGYAVFLDHWDDPAVRGTLGPVVLTIAARQAHGYVRAALYATGRRWTALLDDLLAYPGMLLGLVLLARADRLDLGSAFLVTGGAAALGFAVALPAVAGLGARPHALGATARRHWTFSRWLAAMSLSQWFASNSYLVAAAALLGSAAVGTIRAAQTVMGVLNLCFQAMENVVPASAARLYAAGGLAGLRPYLGRVARLGLVVTLGTSALLAAWPGPVLRLLYDAEAAAQAQLELALRAFALLYVASFGIALLQIALRTVEDTRSMFLAYLVHTGVAVVAAPAVVGAFGFGGAVLGMAAQQGVLVGLLTFAWGRRRRALERAAAVRAG